MRAQALLNSFLKRKKINNSSIIYYDYELPNMIHPLKRSLNKNCILNRATPLLAFLLACCSQSANLPDGDLDNGGLVVPNGFDVLTVAEGVGLARHIAVNDNGDIYVKTRTKGNLALRDTTGDGRVDIIRTFGDYKDEGYLASSMRIHNGYLYFSSIRTVYRQKLSPGKLVPNSEIETILTDDHAHGIDHWHISKPVAFDGKGNMYVPFGVPSNNCQVINRILAATPGAPGLDPCPELEDHGGIWRFDENKINQTQKDGERYATGIRSAVAIAWNTTEETLYAVVHGRDNLYTIFPEKFTPWQSAVLPAEEFINVTKGSNFGWPYYYYDPFKKKRILSPEYGGDGEITGDGEKYNQPLMAFPGHWAPNDLLFYTGDQFPDHYKNGAFIAFHGSNNRSPYPQSGYFVCFVPFKEGAPTNEWEVFADGFVSDKPLETTRDAKYRPMGLSQGPDGSIYLSDSQTGRIWRIMFKGDKSTFGHDQLTQMEDRKKLVHIRVPDPVEDNLYKDTKPSIGGTFYNTYCLSCHQADGKGDGNHFPSLVSSAKVNSKELLIAIILNGVSTYADDSNVNILMPPHNFLLDAHVADLASYVRKNFGNNAASVSEADVKKVRQP